MGVSGCGVGVVVVGWCVCGSSGGWVVLGFVWWGGIGGGERGIVSVCWWLAQECGWLWVVGAGIVGGCGGCRRNIWGCRRVCDCSGGLLW